MGSLLMLNVISMLARIFWFGSYSCDTHTHVTVVLAEPTIGALGLICSVILPNMRMTDLAITLILFLSDSNVHSNIFISFAAMIPFHSDMLMGHGNQYGLVNTVISSHRSA